jgi:hypothetical protein
MWGPFLVFNDLPRMRGRRYLTYGGIVSGGILCLKTLNSKLFGDLFSRWERVGRGPESEYVFSALKVASTLGGYRVMIKNYKVMRTLTLPPKTRYWYTADLL